MTTKAYSGVCARRRCACAAYGAGVERYDHKSAQRVLPGGAALARAYGVKAEM
jgi:hypothetical protein